MANQRILPQPCGARETRLLEGHEQIIDQSLPAGTAFRRGFFDCGKYFFDGDFNVVEFRAGMTLYHGGGKAANFLAQFPVGLTFYQTERESGVPFDSSDPQYTTIVTTSDESIEEAVSATIPVTPGWYASPETARLYSNESEPPLGLGQGGFGNGANICDGRCVLAYRVKHPFVLFLLDDDYNIAKLLAQDDQTVSADLKLRLRQMFNMTQQDTVLRNPSEGPFTRFQLSRKERISSRGWDLPFAALACSNLFVGRNYAGYGATAQHTPGMKSGAFHEEVVFCNAFEYLERNVLDPNDWQFNPNRDQGFHGNQKTK